MYVSYNDFFFTIVYSVDLSDPSFSNGVSTLTHANYKDFYMTHNIVGVNCE